MKQTFIAFLFSVVLLCIVFLLSQCVQATIIEKEISYAKEELITLIDEHQFIKDNTHTMADSARALGWEEDSKLIKGLQFRWQEANKAQNKLQEQLNLILKAEAELEAKKQEELKKIEQEKLLEQQRWDKKKEEYPIATEVWLYMKNLGWNDYVCAGIMGNLMAETGGRTLNLQPTLSTNLYYGMCQWSKAYDEVWYTDLITQCNFLRDTIEYEFNTFGFKYQKGFNYESFLKMKNTEEACLAFAKCYERCAEWTYPIRQTSAVKAYDYFINN